MAVPFFNLNRQYEKIGHELEKALLETASSGMYILGKNVTGLEQEMAEYCGTKYAVGAASGTDALILALKALGIGKGDEVITTPYSFFATASCIYRIGARPTFADIEPDTYNINPDEVRKKITKKTRAVIPVHLFGLPADMDELNAISNEFDIPIVEDAAQAIGAEYKNKKVGSFGKAGCFSYFPTKNLGGMGDGGIVTTNDEKIKEEAAKLRVHGGGSSYIHEKIGLNSRLDEIQAAVIRVKMKYLTMWKEARFQNAMKYSELLANLPEVVLPAEKTDRQCVFNQFVIRIKEKRDALMEKLKQQKIGCNIYYPLPLHQQPCFRYLNYAAGDFPESEKASKETLALPVFPELMDEEINETAQAIIRFFE